MARDIKQQGITGPLTGQTSGFASGTPYNVNVDDFSIMKDVLPNATNLVHEVMGQANSAAFKQGQADQAADMLHMGNTVDSAAALISKSSWLTRHAYSQGVKYQEYTEGQLETQAAIQKQVQESIDNNDTLETFSQKIKPSLATLHKKMHSFGLQGKAKELAQDQILGYIVNAQRQYQEAAEARAKLTFDRGIAQEASSAISMLTNAQTIDDVTGTLDNTMQLITNATAYQDPKSSVQATAGYMQGIVKDLSSKIKSASPVDAMRIDGVLDWLYNSPEAKKLPLKARSSMMEEINKVQGKVHEFNFNQVNAQIDVAEKSFRETGGLDAAWVQGGLDYVSQGELDGTISLQHARTLRNRFSNFYTKADQEAPTQWAKLNSTGMELDAQGIPRLEADREKYAQLLTAYNGDPIANFAAFTWGAANGRPDLMKMAAKGAVQPFANYMGLNTEQLQETGNSGVANQHFKLAGDTYKKLIGEGRIDQAYKILDGFPDKTQQEVARILWSEDGPTPNLGTDLAIRYENLTNGIESGTDDGYNITFTTDAISMGWLGKVSSAASPDRFYGQSDAMKEHQIRDIQEAYNLTEKYAFKGAGQRFVKDDDGSGAIRAMLSRGTLINTKTQLLAVSTEQRKAMGGGIAASDDRIIKGTDAIAKDAIARLGKVEPHMFSLVKNKVDRENILFNVTNSGIVVTALDDKGASIGSPMYYTHGDIYKLSTPAAGATTRYTGAIKTAGFDFNVEADTGTFGSNNLKQNVYKHLFEQEGWHSTARAADPDRPDVLTFGHGIKPATAKHILGEEKAAKFEASAKDKGDGDYQKYFNEFADKYFSKLKELSVKAGVPEPAAAVDTLRYQPVYMAIADAMYHGGITGGGNAMVKILNLAKSDKNAARKLMQQQPFYIQTGKDSGRKEFLMRAIDRID